MTLNQEPLISQRQFVAIQSVDHLVKTLPTVIREHICQLYCRHNAYQVARILMAEAYIAKDLRDKSLDPDTVLEDAMDDEEEYACTLTLMDLPKLCNALNTHASTILLSQKCTGNAVNQITSLDMPKERKKEFVSEHMSASRRGKPLKISEEARRKGAENSKLNQSNVRITNESILAGGREWTREQVGHYTILFTHPKCLTPRGLNHKQMAEKMNDQYPDAEPHFKHTHSHGLAAKLRRDLNAHKK
jgi:hypothetical protein